MVSMNRLTTEQRARIVGCLTEGMSIRATVRVTGAAKNTVTKLLVDLGQACTTCQDTALVDLPCTRIECDEIWSFCYAKQKNVPEVHRGEYGYGDVWTWTAICADTKLVPSWLVGERVTEDALVFMSDLKARLVNRVQLTTDGHKPYLYAVEATFGADIDYAMLHKIYGAATGAGDERRYSPAVCTGTDKKVENLAHAVSLHYMHYNFARPHKTLTKAAGGYPTTPATAAGVADHAWTLVEIASLLDSN